MARPSLELPTSDGGPERAGPSPLVTGLIVVLSVALVGALVYFWRTGGAGFFSPRPASAAGPVGKAEAHAAIEAVLTAAQTYVAQGEPSKAEAVLKQAVAEHPEDRDLRIELGNTLRVLERPGEAYDEYIAALSIGPRDAETEFMAGIFASESGRPDRAAEHFSMARASDPSESRYPLYLGQVQLKMGETEPGKANLLIAGKLDPDNAVVWGTLADVALRENKNDLALQHVMRARVLQPSVASWRVIEAKALKRKGEAEKALTLLLAMDAAERRDPAVLRQIAECYGMLTRPADAAALYEEAAGADPASAELAMEAALWFERAGDKQKAGVFGGRAKMLGAEGAGELLGRLGG